MYYKFYTVIILSLPPFSVAVPEIVLLYMQFYTVIILSLPPFSVAVPEIVL
jgi:type III secretory pathway component EscS